MKKIRVIWLLAFLLAAGAIGALSTSSQAQVYPPPAPQAVAVPWVGTGTPWVFYQGDWFLNGILYNFFGNKIGWAPYYAYAPTYIVRPTYWYTPRWNTWYKAHPVYWTKFQRTYPYWRGHQPGRHYDQNFYHKYHRGQGVGWQKGFHGGAYNRPQPRPGPQPDVRHPGTAGREVVPGHKPGPADVHNRDRHPETTGPGRGTPPPKQPGQYQPGSPAPRQPGQGRETAPPRPSE